MKQGPKTIQELKQWYSNRNLPSENTTRFFIGKDYKGAKAFGIYKDEITKKYVVYKNKADGTRSIRYEGLDEEYAVNQLYEKLKCEIYNQKNKIYQGYNTGIYTGKSIKLANPITIIIIFMAIILIVSALIIKKPKRGYYNFDNEYYYYQNGSWYKYNDKDWGYTTIPQLLKDNYSNYYISYDYMYSYKIDKFENTSYYKKPTSSSSSDYDSGYDYDYDWDSGSSWDSGYTDWDSDW